MAKNLVFHLMRGGAPDKINALVTPGDTLILHDHCNLRDLDIDCINKITSIGEYIIPCDEGDILFVNENNLNNNKFIILPRLRNGEIIPYEFVHKGGVAYKKIAETTNIEIPESIQFTLDEFIDWTSKNDINDYKEEFAIKTTLGSGSRGVVVRSEKASKISHNGQNRYYPSITKSLINEIIVAARKEESNRNKCYIRVEDMIPIESEKAVIDLVQRNGELVGYNWIKTEKGANFTTWRYYSSVNTYLTRYWMSEFNKGMNELGVTDGIYDFEGFISEDRKRFTLCEINWRRSGCIHDASPFGIDFHHAYVTADKFSTPEGEIKCVRYEGALILDKINYVNHLN